MAQSATVRRGAPRRRMNPMLSYILRRLVLFIPTVLIMSLLIFFIIQLPPGDYLTSYVAGLKAEGVMVDASVIARLEEQFGLDKPWYVQYLSWMWNIFTKFDFGYSFDLGKSVWPIIADKLPMTLFVSLIIMLFQYLVSIPLGIYSAVKQYSVGDYALTALGFLGMAVPNFLFAIILMYLTFIWTGTAWIGLFTKEMLQTGIHWNNLGEFLKRLLIPVLVIGTSGLCGTMRSMRAQMLDEQGRQYVLCARAKGVSERTIIWKYCLRAAINPTVSGLSGSLASIFSGSTISAIVMNLEIIGPTLYEALKAQDMYLAGTILLVMGVLIVVGTLLSDILLAWLDPRIRFSERSE